MTRGDLVYEKSMSFRLLGVRIYTDTNFTEKSSDSNPLADHVLDVKPIGSQANVQSIMSINSTNQKRLHDPQNPIRLSPY